MTDRSAHAPGTEAGTAPILGPKLVRASGADAVGPLGWWMRAGLGRALGGALLLALGGTGCSLDGLLNSDQLPENVNDPALTQTPAGAREAYAGTLAQFRAAFGDAGNLQASFIVTTGLLSDELTARGTTAYSFVDQRIMLEAQGSDAAAATYSVLQKVRGQAGQAIGLLTTYLPDPPALRAHLYALQGYAELFLAELFCSGIPLGTLDYQGDFTYRSGSTTTQVFTHAAALFDTALALAGDSAQFADLARVGQARALLGLGDYAHAAATVTGVADGYHYDVHYNNATTGTAAAQNFARVTINGAGVSWDFTVPNQEGSNGLAWRTSGDPRTQSDSVGHASGSSLIYYHPNKYASDGSSPIVLASGVEARLIEAEAALQAGDAAIWRATLNALRTDGTFDTQPTADPNDDPAAMDTLWHAGSGGVAGLAPLPDPGTPEARVDLLFQERGFWLFLTGHRQGDLRRLIRQYGRFEGDVYPVGPYFSGVPYGGDVTAPIPAAEFANPLFTGCASRGA